MCVCVCVCRHYEGVCVCVGMVEAGHYHILYKLLRSFVCVCVCIGMVETGHYHILYRLLRSFLGLSGNTAGACPLFSSHLENTLKTPAS